MLLTYLSLFIVSSVASDPQKIKLGRLTRSDPKYWRTYLGPKYFPERKLQTVVLRTSSFCEALEYFESKAHDLIEARASLMRLSKSISRSHHDVEYLQHVASSEEEEGKSCFLLQSLGPHCRKWCLKCEYKKARTDFLYQLDLIFCYVMDDILIIHDFFEETVKRSEDVLRSSRDVRELNLHRRLLPIAKERLDMSAFLRIAYHRRYTYCNDSQPDMLNRKNLK